MGSRVLDGPNASEGPTQCSTIAAVTARRASRQRLTCLPRELAKAASGASTTPLTNLRHGPLRLHGWARCVVAGLMLSFAASCGVPTPSRSGAGPIFEVANVDGPEVRVTPWTGAQPVDVPCGTWVTIDTSGAPPQPWDVTVVSAVSDKVLLTQSEAGSIEVIVRGNFVLIGAPAPSVGPAGSCPSPQG